MRTQEVDGFLLDHGFHVMQTGYSISESEIDFAALGARSFSPGARVLRSRGEAVELSTYADPFRRPLGGLAALSKERWSDLLKVAGLRLKTLRGWPSSAFSGGDESTEVFLRERGPGLSQEFIDSFFRPLFAGIFLESELRTSERMFRFIFGAMSRGEMILPAQGIQAYPNALAEELGWERIMLSSEAEALSPTALRLGGETVEVGQVIVAHPEVEPVDGRSVWTVQLGAQASPAPGGFLVLNGDYALGHSLIAHLSIPSDVQPTYSPADQALVTATIVGDAAQALGLEDEAQVESKARQELAAWFPDSKSWTTLAVQHVTLALPERGAGSGLSLDGASDMEGLIRCGDHVAHGSVEGALRSADLAAKAAIERLEAGERDR